MDKDSNNNETATDAYTVLAVRFLLKGIQKGKFAIEMVAMEL